ncbi:uncharacterized protein PHALS_01197 [Plasmopara halstedii]|uniref:Uncharacterized protein n=1 Tax=Plasmopara halstedii TaxID=4781 RepID=A0A0P1AU48_PLAHL|nr:uncharacterized protein PHALS_01197 [Plasmopara halstedii]CEG44866.1 hypothetical protein PHALS_01197 [Plasmopara halstedii]|eukprot:XP_024581235.1 hypothetical protein PHALS_01197 [Plasmopara halstedii]
MATAPPAAGGSITLLDEPWTAEGARLLLEVDEGWVGYRGDIAWSWHDETFMIYSAICRERNWPCKSQAASVAMLTALRTDSISMKISSSMRTADGFAQWSLIEMRELGAQMRRIVEGRSPAMRWSAQLLSFVETMKTIDTKYNIGDRTVEEFAFRASKYLPLAIVMLIDPHRTNGKTSHDRWKSDSTPLMKPLKLLRPIQRDQLTDNAIERADESLAPGKRRIMPLTDPSLGIPNDTRPRLVIKRNQSTELNVNKSYHGSRFNNDNLRWTGNNFGHETRNAGPSIQIDTNQEQMLPKQQSAANQAHLSYSQDVRAQKHTDFSAIGGYHRLDQAASGLQLFGQKQVATPHRDTADQPPSTYGMQSGDIPMQRSTRNELCSQQPIVSDSMELNDRASTAPHVLRGVNPYNRPEKSWGEFVVEVLLAQRMASNEDELDYWHFVRNLYEI